MIKQLSRAVSLTITCILLLATALPTGAIPPAQEGLPSAAGGPRTITGSFVTTNPIYPTIGADLGVALYDFAGQIREDYGFVSPPEDQVLGSFEGSIAAGTYTVELPEQPGGGTTLDFDPATPDGVRVFVVGTFINFRGDEYVNRGETLLSPSVNIEPLTFHIKGGHVIVWAEREGESFPAGFGPDGAAFTADDPLMPLPAGWSVVSLEDEPFTIIREQTVDVPLIETLGALNDYSMLDYVEAWERLFERTRETYPFTEEKGLDWDAIYAEVTPIVEVASSALEFHLAVTRFGELIPDTHIGYASMPIVQAFLLGGVGIRRIGVTDAGEVVVLEVLPNMPAARVGIEPGAVLLKVNGTPALQALDETPLLLTSASTPHGRRYIQAATMLQGGPGTQLQLTWRGPDGTEANATMTRVPDASALLAAFGGSLSGGVVDARMLPSGIGYMRVTGFAQEVSAANAIFGEQLQALVDEGAQGIILDVRGNSGGLVNLAMSMAGRFFPDYERLFDFYYANGEGGFSYRGFVEILSEEPTYDGPVAVLVDEMTGSAGDMFAYAMTARDRAVIVGHTPSGGFTGEVSDGQYQLPDALQLQVPTGRPVDPVTGETLIEGMGVQPDVRVPVTRESLLSPEDEVLQAAEAVLLAAQ